MNMKDALVGRLAEKDYENLKTDIQKVVDAKVRQRIEAKKEEVVNNFNGVKEEDIQDDEQTSSEENED